MLGALAATYGVRGRWGTALLAMGGTGLRAALLIYGAILYLRFLLIERTARAGGAAPAGAHGRSSGRGSYKSSARGWSVAGALLRRRRPRSAIRHPRHGRWSSVPTAAAGHPAAAVVLLFWYSIHRLMRA